MMCRTATVISETMLARLELIGRLLGRVGLRASLVDFHILCYRGFKFKF